jgi:hypothetical protein
MTAFKPGITFQANREWLLSTLLGHSDFAPGMALPAPKQPFAGDPRRTFGKRAHNVRLKTIHEPALNAVDILSA